MKVFISYGTVADQVTALRLQALGAVNGLTVYVPPAHTRQNQTVVTESESVQKMNEADVVLGVVGFGLSDACWQEIQSSRASQKPTIVMAAPQFGAQLQPFLRSDVILVDPASPDQAEMGIVQHLKSIKAEQTSKKALVALGTVALGLLILSAFSSQD